MGRPLGPLARKAAEGERKGKTLISGSPGTGQPRDVTDMLVGAGPGFLPAAAHRVEPGEQVVNLVGRLLVRTPGRHNTKAIDTGDPYRE